MKTMQVRRDGVTAFATFVGVISHWGFSVCLGWNFEASTAGLVRTSLHASKIYEVARITTGSVIITLLLSDKIYSVRNAYSGTLLN